MAGDFVENIKQEDCEVKKEFEQSAKKKAKDKLSWTDRGPLARRKVPPFERTQEQRTRNHQKPPQ